MDRPLRFWGFKSSDDVLQRSLGSLEREILSCCWERRHLRVREACAMLASPVAYTTVMTTMDRLYKKGLLSRQRAGRAFVYSATVTREELHSVVAAELVEGMLSRHAGAPL